MIDQTYSNLRDRLAAVEAAIAELNLVRETLKKNISDLSLPDVDACIESLDLSVRVYNSLKRTGVTKVIEILEMLSRGENILLGIRNFGPDSLDELITQLKRKRYIE